MCALTAIVSYQIYPIFQEITKWEQITGGGDQEG